jgi:hypothetical protein
MVRKSILRGLFRTLNFSWPLSVQRRAHRVAQDRDARSISSSLTVSGGAMRKTPPIPGRFTIFIERPSSIAFSVMRPPSAYRGSRFLVLDDLDAEQEAATAHVADAVEFVSLVSATFLDHEVMRCHSNDRPTH